MLLPLELGVSEAVPLCGGLLELLVDGFCDETKTGEELALHRHTHGTCDAVAVSDDVGVAVEVNNVDAEAEIGEGLLLADERSIDAEGLALGDATQDAWREASCICKSATWDARVEACAAATV